MWPKDWFLKTQCYQHIKDPIDDPIYHRTSEYNDKSDTSADITNDFSGCTFDQRSKEIPTRYR